jgi:hypothetical protein
MKAIPEMILEKNIPIPPVAPRSNLGKLLRTMEVGDSFLTSMPGVSLYSLARYHGVKIAIRTNDKGQKRVWRLS